MTRMSAGKKRRLSPLVIALVGAIALVAIFYGSFTKRVPFVEGYRIEGVFQSSNQLRKSDPVRIAGVDVGEVVEIENGPGALTTVVLELGDKGRPVHRDATLRIRPRLFLEGGFFVQLEPGSPSAPEIEDGGTIGPAQTATPVQLHQILGAFNRRARTELTTLLDELGTALEDGGAEALSLSARPLVPALRDAARVAEAARGSERDDVSKLVRETAKVTSAIASRDRELASLVTGLNRTTRAFASEDRAVAAGMRELAAVLREAPEALTAVDRATPPLARLTRAIRPSLRISPPILRDAVRLVEQLGKATRPAELPRTLELLRPTLRDLPAVAGTLTDVAPALTDIVVCLKDKVIPVLTAEVPDGALSTGRPLWQDLVHSAVGFAGQAQSFDGNGPVSRYNFGGGSQMISLGDFAGAGQLVGRLANPILGSNPQTLGPNPNLPFRPDAPCREQAAVNLAARTNTAPLVRQRREATPAAKAPKLTLPQLKNLVERLMKREEGRR